MRLDRRQRKLLKWLIDVHGEQMRKSGEPYWKHLERVAETVMRVGGNVSAALCHDLFEDVEGMDSVKLSQKLNEFGYSGSDISWIILHTTELTDVFTSSSFPDLRRSIRKRMEAERYSSTTVGTQTIKLADIKDNVSDITTVDPKFAKTYISEKVIYLENLKMGTTKLYMETAYILFEAAKEIKLNIYEL